MTTITIAKNGAIIAVICNQDAPVVPGPKAISAHLSLTATQTKPIATLRGTQRLCNRDGAHFTNGSFLKQNVVKLLDRSFTVTMLSRTFQCTNVLLPSRRCMAIPL